MQCNTRNMQRMLPTGESVPAPGQGIPLAMCEGGEFPLTLS